VLDWNDGLEGDGKGPGKGQRPIGKTPPCLRLSLRGMGSVLRGVNDYPQEQGRGADVSVGLLSFLERGGCRRWNGR